MSRAALRTALATCCSFIAADRSVHRCDLNATIEGQSAAISSWLGDICPWSVCARPFHCNSSVLLVAAHVLISTLAEQLAQKERAVWSQT